MPVNIIGMIGAAPPPARAVHVIGGGVDPSFLVKNARAHEQAGYDEVLVGYTSASPDNWGLTAWAAAHTEKLRFLVAHRPGRIVPALMARKVATLDQLSAGRISLHIIIGASDGDMAAEGDFSDKPARYHRGAEFLNIMRSIWTADGPVDFEGDFYRVRGAQSNVSPFQKPYPPIYFGGSSNGALEMGAQHCDVFAMFGEPLKETGERVLSYRKRCAAHGRTARFNISFRPIIGETEEQAWDKAHQYLSEFSAASQDPHFVTNKAKKDVPISKSSQRIVQLANKGNVYDERLWMPLAAATGGIGNTTCLVGTAEQVTRALMKYYALGVTSFLLRGFELEQDLEIYSRGLFPLLRAAALEHDKTKGLAA